MAGVLQHLRSSTLDKRPNPASMVDGQVAINYASGAPGMFFKNSNGDLVKVGPVHVGSGAPNAAPASGGTAGNSIGEQWLDTSGGTYVFKIWDGSAWRSEAGEFVNTTGDTMTGALGIIAGSASTPGLFFSGDANTGIYSPGADQVAVATNGVGRITVDGSGNVNIDSNTLYVDATNNRAGINTASPAVALDVRATGTGDKVYVFNASDLSTGLVLGNGSDHAYLDTGTQARLAFKTNGTEKARLDSNGRLLVGTSSGSALLQVAGTFRAGDQATSGMSGNNATILSATPPSGALAAEIHCFGKDYSTAGANNHVGLLVAYWSADTNTINTTTNVNNSTGANQGFEVIWSSPNLVVRNKTGMSANQSARAWIRWLA